MKIDWRDFLSPHKPPPIKRFRKWLYRMVFNTNAPLHSSSHYRRDHFHDDGQPKLF